MVMMLATDSSLLINAKGPNYDYKKKKNVKII